MPESKALQAVPFDAQAAQPEMQELLLAVMEPTVLVEAVGVKPKRGQPEKISPAHLWLSLVWSVLLGMSSYHDWWRLFCTKTVGRFAPKWVSVDALVARLEQAGLEPLQRLAAQVSTHLAARLAPLTTTTLASFASDIVAIDETTLDAVHRLLAPLKTLPKGHVGLRPGKLATRFKIRTQPWDVVQYRGNVLGNCKLEGLTLLDGLAPGSLLLFDLGYFSFPWFDYLTQMGLWYISRLREKTTYQLIHTYYRHEGILDALVWLGSPKGAHAGHAVRLVRFWDGKALRTYLTNVLDPTQLSMVEIAQLYARRWDIELAFLTLKEHLGLHHWWSSKQLLIVQQIWVVLIVAQLLQALRLQIAAQAGVDAFEVSLPLLVKYVPQLIRERENPCQWVLTHGKHLQIIRPSTRLQIVAPDIALDQLHPLPPTVRLVRQACYLQYQPHPGRPSKPKASSSSKSQSKKQTPTSPTASP
jgi:hypothetical protein